MKRSCVCGHLKSHHKGVYINGLKGEQYSRGECSDCDQSWETYFIPEWNETRRRPKGCRHFEQMTNLEYLEQIYENSLIK